MDITIIRCHRDIISLCMFSSSVQIRFSRLEPSLRAWITSGISHLHGNSGLIGIFHTRGVEYAKVGPKIVCIYGGTCMHTASRRKTSRRQTQQLEIDKRTEEYLLFIALARSPLASLD